MDIVPIVIDIIIVICLVLYVGEEFAWWIW